MAEAVEILFTTQQQVPEPLSPDQQFVRSSTK
jgi:hypothetical protein